MPNVHRTPTDIPLLTVNGVSVADLVARVAALEAQVAELLARLQRLGGAA